MEEKIKEAAQLLLNAQKAISFTGAGISVESGIPTYRGPGGVWENTNPEILELDFFMAYPHKSWTPIRDKFYQYYGKVKPNKAHIALTEIQQMGLMQTIITQNIDYLHQESGSKNVIEFHGTLHSLSCTVCGTKFEANKVDMSELPFCIACNNEDNFLKPDFIFFGEGIPEDAYDAAFAAAQNADLCLIIGTTGAVTPASTLPHMAHNNGAKIIEINLDRTTFTDDITDVFLQGKASEVLTALSSEIKKH